jgi:hypothetical protein
MTTYNLLQTEHGRPIKMWTQGVPVDEKAKAQLIKNRSITVYFPAHCGYARCACGERFYYWQCYTYVWCNNSRRRGRGYWLRHDGGADFTDGD